MSELLKLAKLFLVMSATKATRVKHNITFLRNTSTRNELNHCFMFHVHCEKSDQP